MYIYRGRVAWPPAYPRAYFFSKALSRLLTEKKTGTTFARLLKRAKQHLYQFPQFFNTFQNGINLSETFQKV
tara:strand:+ start:40 stop:255 length:216 start_codon:yes stop_codon:yes gene_type:complete